MLRTLALSRRTAGTTRRAVVAALAVTCLAVALRRTRTLAVTRSRALAIALAAARLLLRTALLLLTFRTRFGIARFGRAQ